MNERQRFMRLERSLPLGGGTKVPSDFELSWVSFPGTHTPFSRFARKHAVSQTGKGNRILERLQLIVSK